MAERGGFSTGVWFQRIQNVWNPAICQVLKGLVGVYQFSSSQLKLARALQKPTPNRHQNTAHRGCEAETRSLAGGVTRAVIRSLLIRSRLSGETSEPVLGR